MAKPAVEHRYVSYKDAENFLRRCRIHPERMRTLCSRKANREGGDHVGVVVQVASNGPEVLVQELSMADGWTGCRFSPASLWLAVYLAHNNTLSSSCATEQGVDGAGPRRPSALELGCGVALAGLTAQALGFDTTLTDILEGHLRNLEAHSANVLATRGGASLRVRCLDWIEDTNARTETIEGADQIDYGSPENVGVAKNWPRLCEEEKQSFDLVIASDVLYEEHHAALLPLVIKRWLRPGGSWILVFAIRDAEMMVRFVRRLKAVGVMASVGLDECHITWETACIPEKCAFCSGRSDESCRSSCLPCRSGCSPYDGDGFGEGSTIKMELLEQVIEAHEGGAILMQGRLPT